MIKRLPFGNNGGFGEGKSYNEYYFSQGMQKTPWGLMTGYSVAEVRSSTSLSGLGTVAWFADASGAMYGVNTSGKIFKETFPAAADWALDHTPVGTYNGSGLIGDGKGRLLYFGETEIGKKDGATYTDAWKTGLTAYTAHPADNYEGMVLFGNKSTVGLIDSADSMNLSAFTLPTSMTVDCLKAGKTGVLIGANLGYRGSLLLWDAQSDRAITPWIWTNGKVLSIERVDTGWIVVTQKEILITNGYTVQKLAPILDDPLSFQQYNVGPQGTLALNNKLFVCAQYGTTRAPAGLYVLDLDSGLWEFVPMSTYGATPQAIYAPKSTLQEIAISYADSFLAKTYLGVVSVTGISQAVLIPEVLANSATEKIAEAAILNLALSSMKTGVQAITFDVSLKIYNFGRALHGRNVTSGLAASASVLPVDGTNTGFWRARVGDEVTILQGANAGQIRHIQSIANEGLSNEVWTLDSALSGATAANVSLAVQPFELVSKKTITAATEIPSLFFNIKNRTRGKKFLLKIVFENMTNAQLELQRSDFVYQDLGYTS
jgi:hypothetical protein